MRRNDGTKLKFLLIPGYPALSLISSLETLQCYNTLAKNDYYSWVISSSKDDPVSSTLGDILSSNEGPEEDDFDVLVVVSGLNVEYHMENAVLNAVRAAGRRGCIVLGLCTGGIVLAKSGVMDGRDIAIHWKYKHLVEEMFLNVGFAKTPYCFDGKFGSTAGGIVAIDLMMKLIEQDHDEAWADAVAHYLSYTPVRALNQKLDTSLPNRMSVQNPTVSKVLSVMEANIEDPLDSASMAKIAGLSNRQIERLFRQFLGRTPAAYYLELRLAKARDLLIQTDMCVTEIALASGFQTSSTLSRRYKEKYGVTPSMVRQGIGRP
ncbi:GlxA family transcriptional regulator [Rhodobacteraceae bacterium KMM 6894]|nr:GlxA family transcriptional regulator [Rhodobacteraceae bacterium KMM 6894]